MAGPPYFARLLDLDTLESLKAEMTRIAVSRGGLPLMSAKGVQRVIMLEQIPTPAANIIKQEILARGGDLATPWSAVGFETPTVDVMLIGNLTTLRSTISKLYRQPSYDLPQIADAIQRVVVHTTPGYLPVASKPNRQGVVVEETLEDLMGGRIPLEKGSNRANGVPTLVSPEGHTWQFGQMTYVMGMVGAAPDEIAAWQRIQQVVAEGAHLIALSGGLTEMDSLLPLIRLTRETYPNLLVAVESRVAAEAAAAVTAGANLLTGPGRALWPVSADTGVPCVITHDQGIDGDQDVLSTVARFFWAAMNEAIALGVREEQIILDAGFGLRKTGEQERLIIRRLRELTGFGRPLLQSLPSQENGEESAATISVSIANGADIVRVHNVADAVRCASMTDLLVRATP